MSFGFDSDFVVCSIVHFEPAAELDLLKDNTWSVQTCAQLWDPEKVLQMTDRHGKKPHKKVQRARGALPYHCQQVSEGKQVALKRN